MHGDAKASKSQAEQRRSGANQRYCRAKLRRAKALKSNARALRSRAMAIDAVGWGEVRTPTMGNGEGRHGNAAALHGKAGQWQS